MKTCHECGKKINTKTDFYFHCSSCGSYGDVILCGDCGIDADTACPECGGMMKDINEEKA